MVGPPSRRHLGRWQQQVGLNKERSILVTGTSCDLIRLANYNISLLCA
jgi:hypothetical protein